MGDGVRTIYLVRQLQLMVYGQMVADLKGSNLTPMQYMLMSMFRRGDALSSAELARRVGVTPQSMNEMIAALERKQLIVRRRSSGHRRILHVSLTVAGDKVLTRCDRLIDRLEARVLHPLGESERQAFHAAMAKLIGHLRIRARKAA